ncbi:MAG: copper homeostasis protein CutC [Paracoccaceae bacterium]|jgi:copper homeostasis protein
MIKVSPKLEVCVDTFAGLIAAVEGGADRIELCSSLSEGGLTPSAGLMKAAAQTGIPCNVMIRPRTGDFKYCRHEIEIMSHDISNAHFYNLNGVVFGVEDGSGNLDTKSIAYLMDQARGLDTTLHRVVDVISDRFHAIDQAVEFGFNQILTSGGAHNAVAGASEIAKMVEHADDQIIIMPGGGINSRNVAKISQLTNTSDFHASCSIEKKVRLPNLFTQKAMRITSADEVRQMKAAIKTLI